MRRLLALLSVAVAASAAPAADSLRVLFLGDNAGHQPAARFAQLQPVFAARGIALEYTPKVADLNRENLAKYDGLMIFANHIDWTPENEKALLDYVASGKGFVPVHCASFCFTKSQPYIDLVGAQFRSHATGVFRAQKVGDHPVNAGFESFASWDETYLHHKHNTKDRTVLEVRVDGDEKEPWTWVRTHGQGRVFYTAWGHDQRTWSHPGFHNLLERGTRWACGKNPADAGPYVDRPAMTKLPEAKPFEFVPATIPFYPPGEKWGTIREPIKQMQKPLPAAESVKHYQVPEGFEVRTFVTEEQLGGGKPICMTWDERGRLWLALTYDYPNELKPAGEGRDRIVVCEDKDGDGVCDEVRVFAEKLSIPTSILRVRDGILVHQAPHTLFLREEGGKEVERKILVNGWGTKDTHAGPSNMRYGFDNWIYGMVGYSGFDGTVAGEKHKFGQGLYRFKVEADLSVSKLEFLRSTNNNSWGVAFDENGDLYGSTANGCPLVKLNIPNRYYEKVRGLTPGALPNIALDNHFEPITDKVRQVDWHGGFTSAAGCSIYTARTYPKEYWNKTAFVSDPTGHLTATFCLTPNGTDTIARYGWNLLAGRDEWHAPIDAQVGPDGQVWVLDWYNIIVQHNPTPQGYTTGKGNAYEIGLRDKKYGRIYRVVYKQAKPESMLNLAAASPETLVQTLKNPNMFWRMHAQRLLAERGKEDVAKALKLLVCDKSVDETGLNAGALHALWTLEALGPLVLKEPENHFLMPLPRHPCVAVRQAASRISANRWFAPSSFNDPNPQVLLAALLAASESKPDIFSSGSSLFDVAPRILASTDPSILQAYRIAAAVHAAEMFGPSVGQNDNPSKEWLSFLERAAQDYAQNAPASIGRLIKTLSYGKPQQSLAVLRGLAAGWPANKKVALNQFERSDFSDWFAKLSDPNRGLLLKLGSRMGISGLDVQYAEYASKLLAKLADPSLTEAERIVAARQAMAFRPSDEATGLSILSALGPTSSPALATGLLDILADSTAAGVGPALVPKLTTLPATVRPAAMRLVLARSDSAKAFLDAVEKGELRFDMLALDQKAALAAHPNKALAERAKKLLALGGGLPDANRQKVIQELSHITKKVGDPGLGKKSYIQHCAKCHRHGSEGQTIGPDLTGFAVHPKEEILIHLLDPSRSVEGNYKAYTARLLDGRTLSGLLASETKTSIELLDAENKRHAINRDDLEELKESPKSLMPDGFEKQMNAEELTNLLEFMTQKGKYVPIPLDKYATISSTKGMFSEADNAAERMIFADWKPKEFAKVPFYLVDPQGGKQKNAILLHSTSGQLPAAMPKTVVLPCNTAAKAIHILGGVAGWASPYGEDRALAMTVRLRYEDGTTEDHPLRNGVEVADYIRRVDVPGSQFAFRLAGGQQIRYLSIAPKKPGVVKTIELVKGVDSIAPLVMAVTIETP